MMDAVWRELDVSKPQAMIRNSSGPNLQREENITRPPVSLKKSLLCPGCKLKTWKYILQLCGNFPKTSCHCIRIIMEGNPPGSAIWHGQHKASSRHLLFRSVSPSIRLSDWMTYYACCCLIWICKEKLALCYSFIFIGNN